MGCDATHVEATRTTAVAANTTGSANTRCLFQVENIMSAFFPQARVSCWEISKVVGKGSIESNWIAERFLPEERSFDWTLLGPV